MVWPLLRGSSPTRGIAPKRQGGSGVLSLRLSAGSLYPFGAWVPKNLARRNLGLLVSAGAMLLEARLGPPAAS